MYNRYSSVVFVLIAVFVFGSCKSSKSSKYKRLPGVWQVQPISIDGSNRDWPSPYPEYDDKAMLGYAVSNDKDNLYITVETGDPATQLKIIRNGLTVWIDRKGEKGEETAINFPIPINSTSEPKPASGHAHQGQGGANGNFSNSDQDKKRMELEDKVKSELANAKEFSLQGFKSCNLQFPILEKDTCGIMVRMALDADNELVWEAVVPFKSFYFKPEISKTDKGRPISVCFETVGSKKPANQGGGNHGGGGMRPSMGYGGMGGMGMGMRMGGGGSHGGNRSGTQDNSMMESLYKSTKTYKKFGIAYQ